MQWDTFTTDYFTAMEWTDCHEDNPELRDAEGFSDALSARAETDCAAFQEANAEDLAAYREATGYTGGVDFWLTRNGHGAGFWDRGLGALGDRLSDASRAYSSIDLYAGDDGMIYGS